MFEIPFNSTDKFQANIYVCGRKHVLFMKGAPERVLERCSSVAFDNETRKLDDEIKNAYTESCVVLANNGERVLGFADLALSASSFPLGYVFKEDPPNFPLHNLRLVISFIRYNHASKTVFTKFSHILNVDDAFH